jgi:hypothetical protein
MFLLSSAFADQFGGISNNSSIGNVGEGTVNPGVILVISNTAVLDTAAVNSVIGLLTVLGGTGSYTYAITAGNGLGLFKIGVGTNQLQVALSLTGHDGSYPLTISATGGNPTPVINTFTIVVSAPGPTCTGAIDLSKGCALGMFGGM